MAIKHKILTMYILKFATKKFNFLIYYTTLIKKTYISQNLRKNARYNILLQNRLF